MTLTTSTHFASASAEGTDWRDTAKSVLEQLESIKTDGANFNLGFLYISDVLAEDAVSILNLFRSVTGIDDWVGCNGVAICAEHKTHHDVPAISAMVGAFPEDSFSLFTTADNGSDDTRHDFAKWRERSESVLALVHGDPLSDVEPGDALQDLSEDLKTFMVGGLSSSRQGHVHMAGSVFEEGLSGVCFSSDVGVSTALSQGCQPIGDLHTITKCEDHFIYEIDGRPPFEVFEEDLRSLVQHKTTAPVDFSALDIDDVDGEGDDDDIDMTGVPEAFQNLLRGDIHVAFLVPGSDKKDFLVRNIMGMDMDQNVLAVSHQPNVGDHILFAHRDEKTIQKELAKMLLDLRERVIREQGVFQPKAAHYVSCVARITGNSEGRENAIDELGLIREVIGEVPLVGFYASGEVSNHRLYAYTGIITLFF